MWRRPQNEVVASRPEDVEVAFGSSFCALAFFWGRSLSVRLDAAKGRGNDMKIVCAGGGPAGLYFSILMKLRNPRHEVTIIERNPAGVTYGWGVVFWDGLL